MLEWRLYPNFPRAYHASSSQTYLDGLQPLAIEFFTSKTAQGTPQHRWVVGPSGSAQVRGVVSWQRFSKKIYEPRV